MASVYITVHFHVKDHYDCSLLHVCIQLSSSMLHCNVQAVFSLVCGQHLVALLFSLHYSLLYSNGRGPQAQP